MHAIEIENLSKSFHGKKAVDGISLTVDAGTVTGYLGPNGAGKTTTLRCLLGLIRPDEGRVLVNGRRYVELEHPVREVGAVLEANSFHPGRTARSHLAIMCAAAGLPMSRVGEVLMQVGLAEAARKRIGGFSMGMRQRLCLAGALLGDPKVLILDEPANGLDPAGIEWLRRFLRDLADEQGVAVLVSSHMLAEVQQTVDNAVIIAEGRLVRQGTLDELVGTERTTTLVRAAGDLAPALEAAGAEVVRTPDGALRVAGIGPEGISRIAMEARVPVTEISEERADLHQTFLNLTGTENEGSLR
ncbi:ABC transporter ATP-binding protein [Nocardiopsis aegyptia]|uniref:ABC transporter ATP-binding protein n=1 Tax=Nocardiopsis aegyptia TaxID=220378 RepID=UPI00366F6227